MWIRGSHNRLQQVLIGLGASGFLGLGLVYVNRPIVIAAIGLAPLLIIGVLRAPLLLVLGFTVFSFFRIHEVFPVLYPLHIPQLLAFGALASMIWGIWSRRIEVYLSRELVIFAMFFLLVSVGLLSATNRGEAWGSWSGIYVKIAIMTFALAWLMAVPGGFRITARVFIAAGILVGGVALHNKINGLDLVEGTRVTIGRAIGSMLGDPNDLALVLLFPASFALATLLSSHETKLARLIAVLGFITVFAAVIATQSRGGLLGIAAVGGVFAWRRVPSKSLFIVLAAVALVLLFALAGVTERASGGAHEEGIGESAMGRIYAWGAAWRMALSHPFSGVGINNFLANYWAYSAHWDGKNHAVHSTWFGVLAETGITGFILFMTMIAVTLRSATVSVRRLTMVKGGNRDNAFIMAQAVEAGLIGFMVSGTFLTMGFTWPFYILLALTAAVSHYAKRLTA